MVSHSSCEAEITAAHQGISEAKTLDALVEGAVRDPEYSDGDKDLLVSGLYSHSWFHSTPKPKHFETLGREVLELTGREG